MPVWVWIAIGAGVVAVIALIVLAWVLGYRAIEKRYLVGLVGRREAITAAAISLEEVVRRMSEADDDMWELFANDPESVERQVLLETASRARLLADELDTQPMTRRLVPVAETLADAAYVVGEEAGKVHEELLGEDAVEAIASVDLDRVRGVFAAARHELQDACEACHFEDESVYGGGLYL